MTNKSKKTAGERLDNFLDRSTELGGKAKQVLKDSGIDTDKLGKTAAKATVKFSRFLARNTKKAAKAIQEAAKDEKRIAEEEELTEEEKEKRKNMEAFKQTIKENASEE